MKTSFDRADSLCRRRVRTGMVLLAISPLCAISFQNRGAAIADNAANPGKSETWPGYQGGNTHRDSLPTDVGPDGLKLLWQCPLTLPSRETGRNLVVTNNLVFVATDSLVKRESDPQSGEGRHTGEVDLLALNADTGAIAARLHTEQVTAGHALMACYPVSMICDGRDVPSCFTTLTWDGDAQAIYLRGAGDNEMNTAYKPFANQADWKGDTAVPGVPLFPELAKASEANEKPRPDHSWFPHMDQYGKLPSQNSFPNISAFLEIDPASPFGCYSGGGHSQCGGFWFFRKSDGTAVSARSTGGWAPTSQPYGLKRTPENHFLPFSQWRGCMNAGGSLFTIGAADDNYGKDGIGKTTGISLVLLSKPKKLHETGSDFTVGYTEIYFGTPDQGLFIGSWGVTAGNDGNPMLAPQWAYRLHSPHKPTRPDEAESYLETDGFFRPKAWCYDGAHGVWGAWKPTKAGGMELYHANADGIGKWETTLGAGALGQDVWPRIAATGAPGAQTIVLFAGNALNRKYIFPGPPFGTIHGWAEQPDPPAAPNALMVFDEARQKIRWTYSFNTAPWIPRPCDSVGWLERTHLVIAGHWAWVGWVDDSGDGDAVLRLVAFDISAKTPDPKTFSLPLGFPTARYPDSSLIDLAPCNGRLYALVLRANEICRKHYEGPGIWDEQIVLGLGN